MYISNAGIVCSRPSAKSSTALAIFPTPDCSGIRRRRNMPRFMSAARSRRNVLTDFVSQRISSGKRACFVRPVGFHYVTIFSAHLNIRQSDAVTWLVDWGFRGGKAGRAVRTRRADPCRICCGGGVQLNDDLIRQAADSRRNTTGSGQINLSVRSHFAGFAMMATFTLPSSSWRNALPSHL